MILTYWNSKKKPLSTYQKYLPCCGQLAMCVVAVIVVVVLVVVVCMGFEDCVVDDDEVKGGGVTT